MPSVTALSCPVCGAPLALHSDHCSYCNSLIVIKSDHPVINPRNLNKAVIDEHIANFRRAVRSDPYDETAHYGLGVAYFNLGLIEYSAGELTEAARLMPENPHIQVQLAVVLRDLVKQGDTSHQQALNRAVENTLKLDPSNVEGLVLKTELLTNAGEFGAASRAAADISHTDKYRSDQMQEMLLVTMIDSRSDHAPWSEIARLLERLSEINEPVAIRMLQDHIHQFRDEFPLLLVDEEFHIHWAKRLSMVKTLFVFAFLLLCCILANALNTDNGGAAFAWVVISVGFPVAGYYAFRKHHRERLALETTMINDNLVYNRHPDFATILDAADALDAYANGDLIEIPTKRGKR